jgi:hypothetical protein
LIRYVSKFLPSISGAAPLGRPSRRKLIRRIRFPGYYITKRRERERRNGKAGLQPASFRRAEKSLEEGDFYAKKRLTKGKVCVTMIIPLKGDFFIGKIKN